KSAVRFLLRPTEEGIGRAEADSTAGGGDAERTGAGERWIGDLAAPPDLTLLTTVESSAGAANEPARQVAIDCGRSFARTGMPASILSSSSRGKPAGESSVRGL